MKRWQQALAAVVGLTGLLAATSPPGGGTDEQPMVITSAHAGRRAEPVYLILRGQLSGLYPGAVKQIKVTLVNDSGHPIRLHRLDGWPVTSSRRECRPSPANLRILDYRGRLPVTVAPHTRHTLSGSIPIAMPTGATPKCSNTRFSIFVSGAGSRRHR
ncbi:hypothetical protein ACFQFC_27865 [Amorphoplanes digitatis]|uniref:Uncharacterized protein n=1 Tax=Actinoplanes digitatis TaxID=1868 RepID=A0A7W7HSI8_9ACTN|nr:hypothetical protein [Actinoplanes digitatis]MBB4759962.1 hypothetical protein [Actinoplanes digitatis]GID96510.1 hypothetical protein Adi01nite_59220 [Actinoplanes digitatis]